MTPGASSAPHQPDSVDVVVPAFNEEMRLASSLVTLGGALAALPLPASITVVDNGSTDSTAEVARATAGDVAVAVRVLSCPTRGKGAAVRHGLLAAGTRWSGFMDADLATSLDALPEVMAELRRGASVVVGSRRHDMSHLLVDHDALRRVGGWAFRTAARRVVPGVSDTQCGFKFFDAAVAKELVRDQLVAGWAFDVELLSRAQSRGLVVREVPVGWRNRPGSRFSPVRDGLASFRDLAVIRSRARRERREQPATALPLAR